MTAARKIPTESTPTARGTNTRELFAEGLKQVNLPSLMEAEREYGDDFARELADLEAGRHLYQLRKSAQS
jgi:hypothetical protein